MKEALGLGDSGGFPYQLSPLGSKVSLAIPAVPFGGKAQSLKKTFDAPIQIYFTPDQYFTVKFREIFQDTKLRHTSAVESKRWLRGPDMKYWPQQLNFAVFCTTQGCGVSCKIFDSGMNLPPQIKAFYIFHVYFTVRRILYQLGGIQIMSVCPETRLSTNTIIITMSLRTKGYAASSALIRRVISATRTGQTTVLEAFTSM